MKKRRSCLVILICAVIAFVLPAWYYGFIPAASGTAKAGIRHALSLNILPSSARVNASGSESWTDYIFEAEISIAPDQFDRLLTGRDFKFDPERIAREGITNAHRIQDYSGFKVDSVWSWSHKPPDLQSRDHGSFCTIYANKARDRVFIRYSAD